MEDINFLKANYEDVPEIDHIMKIVTGAIADSSWFCSDDEDFIKRHIANEGIIFKAVIDEQIAGFLIVRFPGDASDNLGHHLDLSVKELMKVAHMESTAVLPDYRGRRILKSLLEYAESQLNTTDYYMATVHPSNHYSLKNFDSLGYKIVMTTEKYGGLQRCVLCKVK